MKEVWSTVHVEAMEMGMSDTPVLEMSGDVFF